MSPTERTAEPDATVAKACSAAAAPGEFDLATGPFESPCTPDFRHETRWREHRRTARKLDDDICIVTTLSFNEPELCRFERHPRLGHQDGGLSQPDDEVGTDVRRYRDVAELFGELTDSHREVRQRIDRLEVLLCSL